ncbi:type II secretion system protein [Clostridium rectalis]|uniref:type II secretion system protein n=1 Tax=Clostridium rectalis TaxID=2040295 RepID=UPI0013DE47F4|nr:type II secretion system protein [Clostridium rectalis]
MRKHKNGFTIVELLIVMSIIFILMGFILPRFKGYQTKAKKLKVENYARQLYTAVMASYGENNGKLETEKIEKDIEQLVGILEGKDDSVAVSVIDDNAIIDFSLDSNKYNMVVHEDGYTLRDSKGEIIK